MAAHRQETCKAKSVDSESGVRCAQTPPPSPISPATLLNIAALQYSNLKAIFGIGTSQSSRRGCLQRQSLNPKTFLAGMLKLLIARPDSQ